MCITRSDWATSSNVDRNASTNWCGRCRTNPTVSDNVYTRPSAARDRRVGPDEDDDVRPPELGVDLVLPVRPRGNPLIGIEVEEQSGEALAQGQTATEIFQYTARDAGGLTDDAVLTVTVTGVNDAPVANADTVGGAVEDTTLVIAGATLLANDTDPDAGATKIIDTAPRAKLRVLHGGHYLHLDARADMLAAIEAHLG